MSDTVDLRLALVRELVAEVPKLPSARMLLPAGSAASDRCFRDEREQGYPTSIVCPYRLRSPRLNKRLERSDAKSRSPCDLQPTRRAGTAGSLQALKSVLKSLHQPL